MTWIVYGAGAWLLLSLLTGLLVGGAVAMDERAAAGTDDGPVTAQGTDADGESLRLDGGTAPAPRTSSRVPAD